MRDVRRDARLAVRVAEARLRTTGRARPREIEALGRVIQDAALPPRTRRRAAELLARAHLAELAEAAGG